jgi:NAD(P)H-hydrate repair Nnr-like enzyme with NAD(P)H-hydrate epimerase domain
MDKTIDSIWIGKNLMQEAGNSLAEAMRRITPSRRVAIIVGLLEALDF